jgi:small subunit ribosomal protein S16
MVTIRLSRFGRKKAPFYRVVVVDSRKKTTGGVIEFIGTWNPIKKLTDIDKDKVASWVKKGAQISPSVKKLIVEK